MLYLLSTRLCSDSISCKTVLVSNVFGGALTWFRCEFWSPNRLLWFFHAAVYFLTDTTNISDVYEALATPQRTHANMEASDSVDTKQVGFLSNCRLLTISSLSCTCCLAAGYFCVLINLIMRPSLIKLRGIRVSCFVHYYLPCLSCVHHRLIYIRP